MGSWSSSSPGVTASARDLRHNGIAARWARRSRGVRLKMDLDIGGHHTGDPWSSNAGSSSHVNLGCEALLYVDDPALCGLRVICDGSAPTRREL
jgi:hypothetical protein